MPGPVTGPRHGVRAAPAEAEQPGRGPRPELVAAVISHVQLPGGGVGLPVRRRTQCLVLADQAGNVQRRLNVRVAPTVGIPPTPRLRPSSSAVARLSRNQGGIDPGGPIPIFGNADALSRTVPRARGQQ